MASEGSKKHDDENDLKCQLRALSQLLEKAGIPSGMDEDETPARQLTNLHGALERALKPRSASPTSIDSSRDAVRAERQRFLDVLETLPVIIALFRPDHSVVWVNRAYREALGDNVGKPCYAARFGRDTPCVECQAFVPLKTGRPHNWEWTLPNGRTFDIHNFPFVDVDGSPLILEMDIDITERRQAELMMLDINDTLERRVAERTAALKKSEERLRKSENRLALAQQAAKIGSLVFHFHSGLTEFSPELATLHGLPTVSHQATHEFWSTLVHPDDLESVAKSIQDAIPSGGWEAEWRVVWADGNVRWLAGRGKVVKDEAGRPLEMVGVSMDITERKQAEEALRKSEARFALLSETAEALLITTDPQRLMEDLCRKVMLHLDCDVFVNFMADEAAGRLRLNACAGIPHEEVRKIEWLDYGVAVCGCVARDRLRMIAEDIFQTSDARTELVKSYGVQAYCCHPLMAGERLIGTLSFGATRRARFSAEDVELMQALSNQISVAMERIQREEALRESEAKLRESGERLKRAQEIAQLGSWELDLVNNVLTWSDEAYRIFGLQPYEFDGTYEAFLEIVHPDDREAVNEAYTSSLREGRDSYEIEHRIVRKSTGEVRHVLEKCTHIRDEAGRIIRSVGMTHDITERKHVEEELKLAATVYQDSSEAMLVSDADNNIIAVNQAFTRITGYASAEVIGKQPSLLKSDRHDSRFYYDMWEQIRATGRFRGDVWSKRKDGELFAAQITVNTILNADDKPHRHVALISDITDKKRSEDIIWSQANFDALTGLPNRRYFRERLEHEIRNARRISQPMALMFLDLDGFKDINDTLGHHMGDLLLKKAAERLKGCVRDIDTVARLGGDEFTVILSELHDPENADRVARHILKVLSDPIELDDQLAYVSASIGITLYPQDATDAEELIRNADQAMYAAKQEGKNQYHYFTQSMQEDAMYRMRLINDLRGALEGDQFEVVYQPIIELATGKIQKAEALIRWHHPIRGLINPIEFISAAEDTGMITSFGNWVFHHAARQVMRWRERFHPEFQISVNISPMQFRKDGIDPSVWLDHLQSLDLPGHGIVIEITEGLLLDANPGVISQLARLRELGIEVALDDFGTGYSSLSYLQKFDIDYIKIDRAFVRNLAEDSDDLVLCQAIIAMAHKLGLKVIAEGVESGLQHEILANSGCDYAQGFMFSRPVPAHALEELLKAEPFATQRSLRL